MKKLMLSLIVTGALLFPFASFAQATEQGNVVFDVTYGFPNLYTSILKSAYANSGVEQNVKIGGIGPAGIRGEYFVSDKIAIGLEFNYVNTNLTYDEEGTDSNGDPVTYTNEIKANRFRIMPKFSFHYGQADDFDFYSSVAAGYNRLKFSYKSNDPGSDFEGRNFIPISFRIATGAKYFFTENIGLNLEIGLGGGGLVVGGLSVKI